MYQLIKQLLEAFLMKIGIFYHLQYRKGLKKKDFLKDKVKNKNIFFMMTPTYGNLGDQAIEVATTKYLSDYYGEYNIIKVHLEDTYVMMPAIEEVIKEDDIVILQGGGNFGNLYLSCEIARRYIIKHLSNNMIISFPSTLTYTNSRRGKKELKISRKVFSKHSNFIIMSRELETFNFAKKSFKNNKNILIPDMVFYLWNSNNYSSRNNILICLRQDMESILNDKRSIIINQLFDSGKNCRIIDTQVYRQIYDDVKVAEIQSILEQFMEAQVVVTDRLHGMILSIVTNTPCIVFPSFDKKIKGTYNWVKKLNYVIMADISDVDRILNLVDMVQDINNKQQISFQEIYFKDLRAKLERL